MGTQKVIVLAVLAVSMLLNAYTLVVSGLRVMDVHEFREVASSTLVPFNNKTLECDVLVEFKDVYDQMIVIYIAVSIIVPLALVCYFNLCIARVLCTRKDTMLRNFFAEFDDQPPHSRDLDELTDDPHQGLQMRPLSQSEQPNEHACMIREETSDEKKQCGCFKTKVRNKTIVVRFGCT